MIVRIEIDPEGPALFGYRVTHEAEPLYDDTGLGSVIEALVAAVEGLPPDVIGVELAYAGIVSGTYPLEVVALNHEQVAVHAVNTTAAIQEARLGER
jgi:hypothetical protein